MQNNIRSEAEANGDREVAAGGVKPVGCRMIAGTAVVHEALGLDFSSQDTAEVMLSEYTRRTGVIRPFTVGDGQIRSEKALEESLQKAPP